MHRFILRGVFNLKIRQILTYLACNCWIVSTTLHTWISFGITVQEVGGGKCTSIQLTNGLVESWLLNCIQNTHRCVESTWEIDTALEVHKEWMLIIYRWSRSMAHYYWFSCFFWLFKVPHRGHQQFEVALDTKERSCRLVFDIFGAEAS